MATTIQPEGLFVVLVCETSGIQWGIVAPYSVCVRYAECASLNDPDAGTEYLIVPVAGQLIRKSPNE